MNIRFIRDNPRPILWPQPAARRHTECACYELASLLFLANSGEIEISGIFCVSTEITEITVSTFRLGGDLGRYKGGASKGVPLSELLD